MSSLLVAALWDALLCENLRWPGSVEVACMQAGYAEYLKIRRQLNLPILKTGALVVAWNDEQIAQLGGIAAKTHKNGVEDVTVIPHEALRMAEPNLPDTALAALHVPREFVIAPWSSPLAYLRQAVAAGAEYWFNTEVKSGEFDGKRWRLKTSQGAFSGRIVINCSGNQGDIIQRICTKPEFEIRPRKGQFSVYDKSASSLINAIILPVPTPTTKGVVLTKTILATYAGLTAALGIAAYVQQLCTEEFLGFGPADTPTFPQMPMLAQHENAPINPVMAPRSFAIAKA